MLIPLLSFCILLGSVRFVPRLQCLNNFRDFGHHSFARYYLGFSLLSVILVHYLAGLWGKLICSILFWTYSNLWLFLVLAWFFVWEELPYSHPIDLILIVKYWFSFPTLLNNHPSLPSFFFVESLVVTVLLAFRRPNKKSAPTL